MKPGRWWHANFASQGGYFQHASMLATQEAEQLEGKVKNTLVQKSAARTRGGAGTYIAIGNGWRHIVQVPSVLGGIDTPLELGHESSLLIHKEEPSARSFCVPEFKCLRSTSSCQHARAVCGARRPAAGTPSEGSAGAPPAPKVRFAAAGGARVLSPPFTQIIF
eukprot:363446-Chlamydomonas_euryale.AAC.12